MQISPIIVALYQKLERAKKLKRAVAEEENKIEVEEITSKVTFFYEKLRNSVDFKEVHLLRRFAIERNLRRRLLLETLKPQIAKGLIEDLIRSRYLPNNALPEKFILQVAHIIKRYNDLFLLLNDLYHTAERKKYFDWLVGIEACEIDMLLSPETIGDSVIETMYQAIKPRIKFSGASVDEVRVREKNVQLYIAIHKSLVKSDDTIIAYHLFNLYFPDWRQADENLLKGDDLADLLADPEQFLAEAKILINQKYKIVGNKIRQSSIRAVIYIFVTKMTLALIFELPYEVYIVKELHYLLFIIPCLLPYIF